eukprot:TRINITY_DN40899_c0_g1_i1.p1 TRINITY_DN40899_c0_g1~~TRINITY_DN40899_c0_g1_i1.p1  ORF type:complete len:982 (-),score=117.66 TRINITY_DN40899_c0_g1_i1:289-3171(-)
MVVWESFCLTRLLLLLWICFGIGNGDTSFASLDGALASHPGALTVVRRALQASDVPKALEFSSHKTTFFAPTDQAFKVFARSWGVVEADLFTGPEPLGTSCLLQFMAVDVGAVTKTLLADLWATHGRGHPKIGLVGTAVGNWCVQHGVLPHWMRYLTVHQDVSGKFQVQGSVMVAEEILWRNGIIHVVDAVPIPIYWEPLKPRDLKEALGSLPDTRLMSGVLQELGLFENLHRKTSRLRKYTMIVPTDSAIRKLLGDFSMTEEEFMTGGDSARSVHRLLGFLILCGFGDSFDLWLGAVIRGGYVHVPTLCPCGGRLSMEGWGSGSERGLAMGGARVVTPNVLWHGGVVHVVDVVPPPPCWRQREAPQWSGARQELPAPVAKPTARPGIASASAPVPQIAIKSVPVPLMEGCMVDIEGALETHLSRSTSLIRSALVAKGIADRLEALDSKTTLFAPTNEALWRFMIRYGITEDELFAPSWKGTDCVERVLLSLVHPVEYSTKRLRIRTAGHGGRLELPTLCGDVCGKEIGTGLLLSQPEGPASVVIGNARWIAGDLKWCNGVIHAVSEVLVPPGWKPGGMSCTEETGVGSSWDSTAPFQYPHEVLPKEQSTSQAQSRFDVGLRSGYVVAVVSSSLLLAAMCSTVLLWRLMSRSARVGPALCDAPRGLHQKQVSSNAPALEDAHKKAYREVVIGVIDGFEKFSDTGKPAKLGDDLESGGSKSSTRCPSEASWDSASKISSSRGHSRNTSVASLDLCLIEDQLSRLSTASTSSGDTPSSRASTVSHTSLAETAALQSPVNDSNSSQHRRHHLADAPPASPLAGKGNPLAIEDAGDWHQVWSNTRGMHYYKNSRTGHTRWTRPSSMDNSRNSNKVSAVSPSSAPSARSRSHGPRRQHSEVPSSTRSSTRASSVPERHRSSRHSSESWHPPPPRAAAPSLPVVREQPVAMTRGESGHRSVRNGFK